MSVQDKADSGSRSTTRQPGRITGEVHAIGTRLRLERERRGMTLAEFGEAAGLAKTTQASYERGERCPSVDYLIRVHRLGVDVHHVLTGVSAVELARQSFQADLLEDILVSIDTWAAQREQPTPPALRAKLARLFYAQFSEAGRVDEEHMMQMLMLVK